MRTRRRSRTKQKAVDGAWRKVFRDPIHDLISLGPDDEFILDLIDTKEFQRLRRIRQLGLAHLVYPGAEHTRFVHSLGVLNFAVRILERLRARHSGHRSITNALRDNAQVIKSAALLHDLGHGPFSHIYERLFGDGKQRRHEQWSCEIIQDENTEVNDRLRRHGIPIGRIVALICDGARKDSETPRPEPFLKDIVSSQLDADRMDYLLRDSAFTGSRFGRFDHEWILHAIAIGEIKAGGNSLRKLCLDRSKGMGAIQGFLIARMLMTRHVYGHKTTRAYESELLMTLRLGATLHARLPNETPEPVRNVLAKNGNVSLKDYLLLDDEVTTWALRRWAAWKPPTDGEDAKLLAALKRHSLRLVRRHEPWQTLEIQTDEEFAEAALFVKELREADDPLYYECAADDGKFLPYKNLNLLVRDIRAEGDEEERFYRMLDAIYLIDKDNQTVSLEKSGADPILEALAQQTVQYRFFYDRSRKREFARRLKSYGLKLG